MRKVILRADGNSAIGMGHVYRLLALADMLKDEFEIIFAIIQPDAFLQNTISKYVDRIVILPEVFSYKQPDKKLPQEELPFDLEEIICADDIVVTDGYWFGEQYQLSIKKSGAKLICIDDFAKAHFYADGVINHAPGVSSLNYKGESYTKFFLGLDYALLRKEFFLDFKDGFKETGILIGMGGSDSYGITKTAAAAALRNDEFSRIHILFSSLFPDKQELRRLSEMSNRIKLHENLSAFEIVHLFDSCTYAFVSASTTLIECYSRGLICFCGFYTENQLNIYHGFTKENRAFDLGDLRQFKENDILKKQPNKKLLLLEKPLNSKKNILNVFRSI